MCTICGGSLRYRDKVPRIMKRYNGEKSYVMIERRKCQNPDCNRLHRCLPSQLTRFKHSRETISSQAQLSARLPDGRHGSDITRQISTAA